MQGITRVRTMLYTLAVVLVLGGLYVVLVWLATMSDESYRKAFNDLAQIASAIGTVGAVWFAVHASRRDRLDEANKAREAATLRAAGLEPILHDAVRALREAVKAYRVDPLEPDQHPIMVERSLIGRLNLVIAKCRAEVFFLSPDELAAFVVLPDHCAFRLYTSGTQLKQLIAEFEANEPSFAFIDTEKILQQGDRWVSMAEAALPDLRAAQLILDKVRRQATPKSKFDPRPYQGL